MQRSGVLTVKGTQYYSAPKMFDAGVLRSGEAILLRREPGNPYDANAVEVLLARGSVKLGHLSKRVAPKYADLIKFGGIDHAEIKTASCNSGMVAIEVCVSYKLN